MLIKIFILLFIYVICDVSFDVKCNDYDLSWDISKNNEESLQNYEPNWESLDKRPLPTWYDEAKVGIFIHWGVYSVPSFGTEWFWTNWQGSPSQESYVNFMKTNYKPDFTYQDFAKDFTTELFNSTKWALLFKDSGAKYVVLTSKHHDGYALWPSTRSFSWNSMDAGPKRDIIKELSTSIRNETSLKFGLYHSLFEWYNRMYLEDASHNFQQYNYVQNKLLPELHELIQLYQPEILWSDGDWTATSSYWNSTVFLAWLYNASPVRQTIVTNDRWGSDTLCKHGDFYTCSDRYNPGVLLKHKWENAFTLDKTSWGHRFDTDLSQYMTSKELIKEIVSTISCNGNVLVNIGPTKYGTIPPIFEERLRDMGNWLKNNGEAIYGSKPWIYQNDTITKGVWYTQKSTDDADRINVYAMIVDYPYDTNAIVLHALGGKSDSKTTIEFLGLNYQQIKWKSSDSSLYVKFPPKNLIDKYELNFVWTLKISNIKKDTAKKDQL